MSKSNSNNGIGVLGLLGVAFVVLKLTGVIDWSWWWVTIPFWGSFAILIVALIIYYLFLLIGKKKKPTASIDKNKPYKSRFQRKMDEQIEKSKLNEKNQ